jgi:alpha-L-fucosidase
MEDIAHGERILAYRLTGRRPDGQWLEIARGRSVGHKRIEHFAALEVTALRLTIDQSKAEPRLRQFAAYAGA